VDDDHVNTILPRPGTGHASITASRRERVGGAVAAFGMVAMFACVLIFGLQAGQVVRRAEALVAITLTSPPSPPPQPAPPPPQEQASAPAADKAASPRNLKNQATQIVVPTVILLMPPPPVIVAPRAGLGSAASNGAADVPGPGQGAGGVGDGTGGGGSGGSGAGGGGAGPRQIKGRLSSSDLPDGVLPDGGEISVGVRYAVEVDGTVGACRAERSSGIAVVDATVCRLIQQRFRFKPARDRGGQPVASTIVETHGWIIEPGKNERQP
jgi:protein TonB